MTDNSSDTRDKLAIERTRLANERTFLAYVRTGLALLGAAAVLFQFFAEINSHVATAWVLAAFGLLVLVIGLFRFNRVRTELNAYTDEVNGGS
jgi:putative membrane protein